MTTLAASDYFTNPARTNSEAKTAHNDTLEVIREQPGGAAEQALTIASGVITPAAKASRAIKLAGEGAADDILDNLTLTNVPTGALVILRANGTQEITLNHGAGGSGQMLLRDAADYLLDSDEKRIAFMVVGTDLLEIWRSHEAVFESALITLPVSAISENSQAHGLGGAPDAIHWFIECQTAEAGYTAGDRLSYDLEADPSGATAAVFYDATDIKLKIGGAALNAPINLPHKSTFGSTAITDANWKLGYRAWRI